MTIYLIVIETNKRGDSGTLGGDAWGHHLCSGGCTFLYRSSEGVNHWWCGLQVTDRPSGFLETLLAVTAEWRRFPTAILKSIAFAFHCPTFTFAVRCILGGAK